MRRTFWIGNMRSRCDAAPSAPRSISGSPKVASSEAKITSHEPTIPMPPPSTKPCAAAITGTGQSWIAAKVS